MAKDIRETFKALKEAFPTVSIIEVGYYGGGDSFDSFNSVEAYDGNKNQVDIDYTELMNIADEFLYYCLDNSNADFNDGGSEGTIKLDLDNFIAELDNYELYTESRHTGTEHF
jgi:hypothetical protein